jgi:hypothetical protein
MFRWLFVSVCLLAVLGGAALGCGSNGSSASDAKLRCMQYQNASTECVTDKAYAQCISCFEQCGDMCVAEATCPQVFSCNDTTPSQ